MTSRELLNILHVAERLKDAVRHCDTSGGRRESVADHSWRLALMAFFLRDAFPDADMDKVVRMCLIHDLGEAFTGDIPTFRKSQADVKAEDDLFLGWVDSFPEPQRSQWRDLLSEMNALSTRDAKIYKALDKMEAVISHDESDLSTWLPLEYDLQLTYGRENVTFSPWFTALKAAVDRWTREKIEGGTDRDQP